MIRIARGHRTVTLALVAMLTLAMLSGCSKPAETADAAMPTAPDEKPIAIKIGTLATEDSLPLWVAEKMGYFATQGIPRFEIVSFPSAQERDVAFASGAIDSFMGDMIASANLEASGEKNSIATIMLGNDTKTATDLSQTVLVISDDYLAKTGGVATKDAVLAAWDLSVNDINKAPDAYRELLVEKARLPKPLATTYKVNAYPTAQLPTAERVDAILGRMKTEGYLKGEVTATDLLPAEK